MKATAESPSSARLLRSRRGWQDCPATPPGNHTGFRACRKEHRPIEDGEAAVGVQIGLCRAAPPRGAEARLQGFGHALQGRAGLPQRMQGAGGIEGHHPQKAQTDQLQAHRIQDRGIAPGSREQGGIGKGRPDPTYHVGYPGVAGGGAPRSRSTLSTPTWGFPVRR